MHELARRPRIEPPGEYRPPPLVPAATSEPPLDLRRLVRSIIQRRWQVLLVALVVIIPVALWTLTRQPLYLASALIEISPDPVQVFPYRELDRPSLTSYFEMFLKGQDELLRGETLRKRVSGRLAQEGRDPSGAERRALRSHFSLQRLENTYLFRIGYLAPDPQTAAWVANVFAEEYIKHHFEAGQQTRERARQKLQSELDSLEQRVQQSERGLVSYAQDHKLSLDHKNESPARIQLTQIAQQQLAAEGEVFAAQSRLSTLEATSVERFPSLLVTPLISGLIAQLLQKEHELASLQGTFGQNWPAVVAKRQEVAIAKDQVGREQRAALDHALAQARLDLSTATHKRNLLTSMLTDRQRLVNDIENATVQYNIIRREVETNQKMYEGMLERLKQTSITSGMEFGGIRIMEPATEPANVYSPKVWWNLALASVLGLALGLCLVLGRDYWDTSVWTVEQLEHFTMWPVLGTVPLVEGMTARGGLGMRRILHFEHPVPMPLPVPARERFAQNSPAADAVRNVCASILLSSAQAPPRVLMVTSAVPGEGKTTLACELAHALSERGAKTVLVECDLRRPKFAVDYGVSSGGLTPWLAGLTSDPPCVHQMADGLSIVVAGRAAPNPVTLLCSERMTAFVMGLIEANMFVILDAPPVLGLADARLLAPLTDGVVVVARAGVSQVPLLRTAQSLLESAGANILGVVLNGTSRDDPAAYRDEHYYSS